MQYNDQQTSWDLNEAFCIFQTPKGSLSLKRASLNMKRTNDL